MTLHCSAMVNVATIKKSTSNKAFQTNLLKSFVKSTPQDVVSMDMYTDHNVELSKAPARISVEV